VTLPPWQYLFLPFTTQNFHDIFWPIVVASIFWLVALIVLYNVRTRRLRAHPPYLDLYEWLLWTGLITFSLTVVYAIFRFDFFFVPATLTIGLATLVWIRFWRFTPIFEAYATRLAKQRYFSRSKYAHPEATIRPKAVRRGARTVRVAPSKRARRRR
jgi:hypothetical protein